MSPSFPTAATLPVPTPADSRLGGVLFALNQDERGLFFPGGFREPGLDVAEFSVDSGSSLLETLRRQGPSAVVTSWSTPGFQAGWLDELPELRYIAHTTGSVRNLVPREFLERGILVTNWGNLAGVNVAEHALLLILAGLRRMREWPPIIAGERRWHPSPVNTQSLYGRRVGLHGFGKVARALVHLLRPFGVELRAYSAGVPWEEFDSLGVIPCRSLESLFSQSEILVECEALTELNRQSVTAQVLDQLPSGALFVNVGRGALVDEAALAEKALQGHIRLALDVFATDPIAPNSPLHQVEDAILSPHIAGPTRDQMARCGALVLRNLHAFYAGMPLDAMVTLELYDRGT